jgi:arsenate reductase
MSAGMKATIWHNPRCSKSREALAILHDAGADVTVIEYLKDPPPAAKLKQLYAAAGIAPRDGLRKDARVDGDDAAVLAAMAADPAIIERPLVETVKGVRLGRPPERVREIL